ncbi:hypothetical protein PINS_up011109 [Pythium insidiosum]|nr:hypothetical protein PINS_up011109 [Pythium insidiosum]
MERKATAFLSQFSATLYAQWTSESSSSSAASAPLFWRDTARLREILEEGVAKLPAIPLKGHLRRELSAAVAALQAQLEALHKEHVASVASTPRAVAHVLLSEQDVEPVLSELLADQDQDPTTLRRVENVPARELLELVEQCVSRVRVIVARGAERSTDALRGKCAFFLQQIVRGAEALTRSWLARAGRRGAWCCDSDAPLARERERLRHALRAVSLAVGGIHSDDNDNALRTTPFYRPEEHAQFRSLRFQDELAAVHGASLALAIVFPIVSDADDDDDAKTKNNGGDDTSDESSDDEETEATPAATSAGSNAVVDCVALARLVTRQIVLASGASSRRQDWFLAVLSAFHRFPRPSQYVDDADEEDEDEDEEDSALSTTQRSALDECLTDLYRRAFSPTPAAANPWAALQSDGVALVRAVRCLRHAATRVRATQTALSTALSTLVAVPLPPSFWRWMWHVKKVYAGEHAVVQRVMKALTKNKGVKKMANVLLQDSVLSLDDLDVLVQHYELFVVKEHEQEHFVVAGSRAVAAEGDDKDDDKDLVSTDATLFFVDNAGGQHKQKQKKTTAEASSSPARPTKRARS